MALVRFSKVDKKEYYKHAVKYFQDINSEEYENIKFDEIVSKSIAIFVDHDFIPTPCIQIKLELYKEEKVVGSYCLYIDKEKQFIDEFLVFE